MNRAPKLAAAAAAAVALGIWSVTPASAETGRDVRGSAATPSTPVIVLAEAKTGAAVAPAAIAPPAFDAWSPAEVAAGIAQCQQLFAGKDISATLVPPFKDGDCGAPAAVQLVSVGKNPEVILNPSITVTCEMASTFASWVKAELQPLAKGYLGAPVIRVDTMSSYSCRNAYGRKKSRLSEHGRANAIDVRAFIWKTNQEVAVLTDWGPSERAQAAIVAAAKAAEAKRVALADAKAQATRKPAPTSTASITQRAHDPAAAAIDATPGRKPAAPAALALTGQAARAASDRDTSIPLPRLGTLIEGLPGMGQRVPTLVRPETTGSGFGEPSHLGGAKPAATAPSPPTSHKQQFLKAVHASACRTFGTVLGPEANAMHENHFHFDMAERQGKHFCE